MKRQLILENGEVFVGEGFGANVERSGEVVFNTGMTGYQEVLSDLSNCGQIVTFTNPLIGNYGLNRDDFESITSAVHGLIVKEYEHEPSHWNESDTLESYLKEKGIPGLAGIDTRKLTRMIRTEGMLRGKICSLEERVEDVVQQLKVEEQTNAVELVSTKEAYRIPGDGQRVVVIDFGLKRSVLQELVSRGCDIIVVPHLTTAEEICRYEPDGVLLSNGPGNPEGLPYAIETVKQLLEQKVALFGLSLGHQLLALASGAKTCKLLFGHRGANYPVRDLASERVVMTTQNHSYVVERSSLAGTDLELTYIGLNDQSVEGVKHVSSPAFGVQFIPGSYDANELYDEFINMMELSKRRGDK